MEEVADLIVFIYYSDPFYHHSSELNIEFVELIIAKNQHGQIGTINLEYQKDYHTVIKQIKSKYSEPF